MPTLPNASFRLALLGLTASFASAQTAPARTPAPPPAAPTEATATVELSPFEVRAEDDAGYQAANTTSGNYQLYEAPGGDQVDGLPPVLNNLMGEYMREAHKQDIYDFGVLFR